MDPLLKFYIFCCLTIYFIYKIVQSHKLGNLVKRNHLIYVFGFWVTSAMFSYPFNLSISVSLAFLAFYCAFAILYNILRKKVDTSFVPFFGAFLVFGMIFLIFDMYDSGWGLFPKSHLASESNSQKKPTAARRTKNPDGGLRRSDHWMPPK